MKKIFILIGAIGIILAACKTTQSTTKKTPTMTKLEWSILKEGGMGRDESPRNALIKSQDEWQKEWKATHGRMEPMPAAPEVDFNKYWVIACHIGMRSNGGYSATIKDITNTNGGIIVKILEKAPGVGCMNTEVITHPYVYVKIAHFTETNVSYKNEKVMKDCN